MSLTVDISASDKDANSNLKVTTPATEAAAGFTKIAWVVDDGLYTGSPKFHEVDVSEDGQVMIGHVTNLALYNYVTTSQNTGDNKYVSATMTCTQSGGFLNINPGLATVSGNYTTFSTHRYFSIQGDGDLSADITGQLTGMPPSNQIFEVGFFIPTAGTVPADGVFFRVTSSGVIGVISYGGSETQTSLIVTSLPANTNGEYGIRLGQRSVEFYMNGASIGAIAVPNAQAIPCLTTSLPLTYSCRNSGTVVGGATMKIGTAHITQEVLAMNESLASQQATQGNAYQGQDGDTMGSNCIYSNAALAAAAALTNTTAAAGNTGLGGAALVLPTLASGTDGILFSFQNPVGSTTQPPKTLVVHGVTISAGVQVVLAGGPLTYAMGVAFGHTAVSLATAETGSFVTGTTKAPRRVLIGTLNCVATAAAGTSLGSISYQFISPLVVNPGEFFAITARNVGTVTTTGAVLFTVGVDHYFK